MVDAIIAVSLLLLALASMLKQGYKKEINRLFAAFSCFMSIWLMAFDFGDNIWFTQQVASIITGISCASGFITLIFLMLFILKLVSYKKLDVLAWRSLWLLWPITAVSATPLVAGVAVISDDGKYYNFTYGPLEWLYAAGILFTVGVIAYGVIYGLSHAKGMQKHQLKATGIGLLISIPPTVLFALLLPLLTDNIWWTNFGTAPILILVISLYFGVVRYHLFDIRAAAVRTLAYVLSLAALVAIYYVLAIVISSLFSGVTVAGQSPLDVILTIGLLFIFQPIKKFFDRLTNSIFYHDFYKSDEFFARLNNLFTSTTDLRNLLERTAGEIATTLKSEQAFFFVHTGKDHYVTAGTARHQQLPPEDALFIQSIYGKKPEVIVASMLDEDNPIRRLMISHRIEIILTLVQADVIGYLCLGDHRTSHYTNRDAKVLLTAADGLVVAVKNALSIQEIKNINVATTQQHIDAATKELRISNALLQHIDSEKDEFVSVASHELRTPMTVIRGYISLLEREQLGPLDDGQKAMLGKMGANTKILIDLVNNMLDLSKIESGSIDITLTDNLLDDLIDQAFKDTIDLYNTKGVKLTYKGPKVMVSTDTTKFERIMFNLLNNAYKFTDAGGKVSVTSVVDDAKQLVTICVADTGIGVAEEAKAGLFRKFSQVDNYLERQSGGSGLGLAICKGLVEKLDGKIWLESTIGVGSKFIFTMPMSDNKQTK